MSANVRKVFFAMTLSTHLASCGSPSRRVRPISIATMTSATPHPTSLAVVFSDRVKNWSGTNAHEILTDYKPRQGPKSKEFLQAVKQFTGTTAKEGEVSARNAPTHLAGKRSPTHPTLQNWPYISKTQVQQECMRQILDIIESNGASVRVSAWRMCMCMHAALTRPVHMQIKKSKKPADKKVRAHAHAVMQSCSHAVIGVRVTHCPFLSGQEALCGGGSGGGGGESCSHAVTQSHTQC